MDILHLLNTLAKDGLTIDVNPHKKLGMTVAEYLSKHNINDMHINNSLSKMMIEMDSLVVAHAKVKEIEYDFYALSLQDCISKISKVLLHTESNLSSIGTLRVHVHSYIGVENEFIDIPIRYNLHAPYLHLNHERTRQIVETYNKAQKDIRMQSDWEQIHILD